MPEYTELDDALKAERIAVQALDIDPVRYGAGVYGKHKIQFTKLRRSAYCVIELPLKAVPQKKTS
jgi:hypothetical protein